MGAQVQLDFTVDVLDAAERIQRAINGQDQSDREGFVKNLTNAANHASDYKYNVLVFNLGQKYTEELQGKKVYGSGVYAGVTFGFWVFEDGIFYNQGEGTYENWAFVGSFERSNDRGHKVTFYKR